MSHEEMFDDADKFYEVHMLRMRIVAFVIGFAAATFLMIATSRAEQNKPQPLLKEQIVVTGSVVRLGDLFENAGDAIDRAVFRSPDLGQEGIISARRVREAAARHGLVWPNFGGVETVSILRDSKRVDIEEQKTLIRKALSTKTAAYDSESLDIRFDDDMSDIHLSPRSRDRLVVKSLQHNGRSGYFRAVLSLESLTNTMQDRVVRGHALETTLLHVPRKPILPGEVVSEDDLKILRLPTAQIRKSIAKNLDEILGKAVKRKLFAERPIRLSDLEEPKLVRKSGLVDVLYERKGLSLKAEGRALQDGALGDTIKVMNTHSRKTIMATVVGSGTVSVTGPIRPHRPQQFSYNQSAPRQKTLAVIQDGWDATYSVR